MATHNNDQLTLAQVEGVLEKFHRSGRAGQYVACCPAHPDHAPSMSISTGMNQDLVMVCHAGCSFPDILRAIRARLDTGWVITPPKHVQATNGAEKKKIVAVYPYRDASGQVVHETVRYEPKDFRQRVPTKDGWKWNMNGVTRVLYNLPGIIAGMPHEAVWIVEGEKDADRLIDEGVIATTMVGGVNGWKPEYEYERWLTNKHVIICFDVDEEGVHGSREVADAVKNVAASVKRIMLPGLTGEKGKFGKRSDKDISDWLDRNSIDDLLAIAASTPVWGKDAEARERRNELPIRKLKGLIDRDLPEPEYTIDETMLQGSCIMLAGRAKAGKTRLVTALALDVALGQPFLGYFQTKKGSVLFLCLEDGDRRFQRRINTMYPTTDFESNVDVAFEWKLLDDGGIDDMQTWVETTPNARLIVVDTFERVRPIGDPKVNAYRADYAAFKLLTDFAHATGVSIVVVHHTNKTNDLDPHASISGSMGVVAAVDGAMVLVRNKKKLHDKFNPSILSIRNRDLPNDPEHALLSDEDTGHWRYAGESESVVISMQRARMLEILRDGDSLTPKQLAEALTEETGERVSDVSVRQMLKRMLEDELIRKTQYGQYAIAPKGRWIDDRADPRNLGGAPQGTMRSVIRVVKPTE